MTPLLDSTHAWRLPTADEVRALPSDQLPAFVAHLASLQAVAAVRLFEDAAPPARGSGDRMLNAEQTAERMGMSRDWLYRNGHTLPFARHIGRRLVFSEQGLDKWLSRRH